ncbi:MAG TPA: phage tail tube protein [Planctomycetota bacterium]|nr:phage tail tube protein [Planctomycetota bacterium]
MVCGAVGALAKVALKKNGNAWGGAAATLGANDRLPFSAEGLGHEDENFESRQITGTVWRGRPIRVAERIAGELAMEADYDYLLRALALAMGTNTPTTLESGVRYRHQLDLDDDLCGIYATLGVDRVADHLVSPSPSSAYVYDFAKLNGFALRYSAGEPMVAAFPVLVRDEDTGNTSAAWTYESEDPAFVPKPILFSHGVLRVMERDDTGTLDTSPDPIILRPVTFGLVCERKLAGATIQDRFIAEPSFTDFPQVDLTCEFDEMDQELWDLFVQNKKDETALKLDFVFTGPALGSGFHVLKIEVPSLYLMRAEPQVREPGKIPLPLEGRCEPSDGTSITGMTGIEAPVRITIDNAISANPLA